MCTVTFIPSGRGFLLTSNRDELVNRPASPPRPYRHGGQTLIYPRDERAHGSWIGAGSQGIVACLLNGADEWHAKQAHHTHSRGLILLESLQQPQLAAWATDLALQHTEPFTLLHFSLEEEWTGTSLVWDGSQKRLQPISMQTPGIWASATLYPAEIRAAKREKFRLLHAGTAQPDHHQLIDFHRDERNLFNGMDGQLRTVSISQLECTAELVQFAYRDLLKGEQSSHSLKITACATGSHLS